jgi:hypothetical protein
MTQRKDKAAGSGSKTSVWGVKKPRFSRTLTLPGSDLAKHLNQNMDALLATDVTTNSTREPSSNETSKEEDTSNKP